MNKNAPFIEPKPAANQYPYDDKRFFTQIESSETIALEKEKPDVIQIISSVIEPEIMSVKIVNTMKGLSSEGHYLTGKKAAVRIRLKVKILYSSSMENQTIYVIEHESYQSASVIIPMTIEGTDPDILLKHNYLKPRITIENTHTRTVNPRSIFSYVCLFIEFYLVPTYEICYALQQGNTNSTLYIAYPDMVHNNSISSDKDCWDNKPAWSPSGQEIAFLSSQDSSCMLNIVNIKDFKRRIIIDSDVLKSISSFCWAPDSKNMILSANANGIRELFTVEIKSGSIKQLTYGNSMIKSNKPQCSSDGRHIGFLKTISGVSNLYIMDLRGLDCRQVTDSGFIKDFSWSGDGKRIACIRDMDGDPDEIAIINIESHGETVIKLRSKAYKKRNIKFSPNDRFVAYIGTNHNTDDIYIIDLDNNRAENITNSSPGITVGSLCWNADSTKLYYSANELRYYNIYSVSINDKSMHQLTNTTATMMEICYRPRIK